MADSAKIVLVGAADEGAPCSRYTEYSLTQCFQFIGCKPRRSQKASRKVFWLLAERERSVKRPMAPTMTTIPGHWMSRGDFETLVLSCLGEHPRHLPDAQTKLNYFRTASQVVVEKTKTLIVLLCGTSGSGKSTLASLVASRLGIAHVMSTDVIRNLLRGLDSEKAREYLWKSTYEGQDNIHDSIDVYAAQRTAILERAEMLVDSFVTKRKESLLIEGVHLSGEFAVRMIERYPQACILPFLVFISNEEKHLERFAVRAKAMTLRPDGNRYVKHLSSIRNIQWRLIDEANELQIPQVDNTNVDRSLAAIHETVLGVLADDEGKREVPIDEVRRKMQRALGIFFAKTNGRSGKIAEAQIKALNERSVGVPTMKSPLSSSTSIFTLHRPSTVDNTYDNNDADGSDEGDSEYDEGVDRDNVMNLHDGSVREMTTTQGFSLNE